jgi:hypothetical protein
LSFRIQIGNRRAENVISSARAGDFSHFSIAAAAEVRDLAIIFYTSILDGLSKRGALSLQIQSAKWGRKKDLALAVKKPIEELGGSLIFRLDASSEIEHFLYEFWHRGALRFFVWQNAPSSEAYQTIRSFSAWPDAQEFHSLFPDFLFALVDLDIWEKSLHIMILTENASVVRDGAKSALPLLNHPMTFRL